jgi:hypothetical protein
MEQSPDLEPRQQAAILRHRCHRLERREALIKRTDIQLIFDWHRGTPGLAPVIG